MNQRQLLTSSLQIFEEEELTALAHINREVRDYGLEFVPEREYIAPSNPCWCSVALGGFRR